MSRLLTLSVLLVLVLIAVAAGPAQADSIIDQVNNNLNSGALVTEVDIIGANIVSFVRNLAALGAVVFLIWAGIIFWVNGHDARAIAQAKTQLVIFLVALFLIMGSEQIVGAIFNIFGWRVHF